MLFTFPSRYLFTIGLIRVFSLAGWSRLIHAELLVLRATQEQDRLHRASHTGLSPSTAGLSSPFRSPSAMSSLLPYNPGAALPPRRFGLLPVRSPLLGESLDYFLLLEVLRCFSSLGSPPELSPGDCPSDSRVVPFGNPRINGHLHLHAAYRSLSRPSSPG